MPFATKCNIDLLSIEKLAGTKFLTISNPLARANETMTVDKKTCRAWRKIIRYDARLSCD